jgi:segregation and condensation protein B
MDDKQTNDNSTEDLKNTSDSQSDDELSSVSDVEQNLHALFEALLFLANEPLSINYFTKNFNIDKTDAKIVLDSLIDEYNEKDGGVKLVEISNGYQFVTNPYYAKQIRRIMGFKRKDPLTKGMLETLSIISYKQPIVLAEVDELRGVSSRMMVANLMKRNLIKPVGRKELPGRPLAYGTTDEFLRVFGLNKLSDLPKLSEIKEFTYETDSAMENN